MEKQYKALVKAICEVVNSSTGATLPMTDRYGSQHVSRGSALSAAWQDAEGYSQPSDCRFVVVSKSPSKDFRTLCAKDAAKGIERKKRQGGKEPHSSK